MFTLQVLAPVIVSLCFSNFTEIQGELCNFRQQPNVVLKYDKQDLKGSCYRDGVYYPNCKDLDNQTVLHYHNLLNKK